MKKFLCYLIIAIIILLPKTSFSGSFPKINKNNPVELYCGIVYAIGSAILTGRDKGIKKEKIESDVLKIDFVAKSPELQHEAKEIIKLAYEAAPNTSKEELLDFIFNDACIKQLNNEQKK